MEIQNQGVGNDLLLASDWPLFAALATLLSLRERTTKD
jgi:hypothetical protein